MKTFLLSLAVLALAWTAASPTCEAQGAAPEARRPLQAPAPPQAPVSEDLTPHSPTPPCPNCQCGCTVTGKCYCKDCDHPLLVKPISDYDPTLYWPDGTPKHPVEAASPTLSLLIISETACPPCLRLKAALNVAGMGEDYPHWDIWTDSPNLTAKYHVTAFPTVILLQDGREVARRVGYASPAELQRWADDPSQPVSRGACVEKQTAAVRHYQPVYTPLVYYAPVACAT